MSDYEQPGPAKEVHQARSRARHLTSAASRVFAITELLELIILQVVNFETSERDLHYLYKNFIKSPIQLQAVDRTFQATIQGSQTLLDKCLVPYLTPDRGHMNRLFWLLTWHTDAFRVSRHFEIQLGRRVLKEDGIMLRRGLFVGPWTRPLYTGKDASWRRLPCMQRNFMQFRIRLMAKCLCAGCIEYSSDVLVIDHGTTLGDVWDRLHAMLPGGGLLRCSRHSQGSPAVPPKSN